MPRLLPSLRTPESRYSVPPNPDLASQIFADDPVDLAVEHRLPQGFDVLAWADRRIDLGMHRAFAVGIEQKMANRYLASESNVRKHLLHGPRSIDSLARAQVQQVDVQAIGLVRQVGGDPYGKTF
jgi:hypothetical protein